MASMISVVVDDQKRVVGVFKAGGAVDAPQPLLQSCINAAKSRCKEVVALLPSSM